MRAALRKPLQEIDDDVDMEEEMDDKTLAVKDDPTFTLAVTRGEIIIMSDFKACYKNKSKKCYLFVFLCKSV